jgi:hypothetical protein
MSYHLLNIPEEKEVSMQKNSIPSFVALLSFLFAALLGGCGSGTKEGVVFPTTTAKRIDNTTCTNSCHAASEDDAGGIVAQWDASIHKMAQVDCQSCHGPGSLHYGMGPLANPNPDDSGYCSNASCHGSASLKPPPPHFPNLTPAIISSPVIWDNMSTAGYVTAKTTNKCRTCHAPHDNTVLQQNKDWADSGHGDTVAQPWIHYDFKARDDCNRCHTTTGYVKYVTTGDKLAWATANSSDKTKEVLRCDGCHTDYSWKRRALGPVKADYTNVPSFFYPDAKTSNICLNCHIGRESGDSIKYLPATTDFTNASFINSHYLTAGGTLFAKTGYEFSNRSYVNVSYFAHDKIGITDIEDTGTTRGPCVSCHLTSPNSHTFLPVTKNASDVITALTSTLCANCHSGAYALTPAELEGEKKGLAAALDALRAQLSAQGYTYSSGYPYFSSKNWEQAFGSGAGPNTMGAAFNFNLLINDPGAFAHNRFYTKRLIYDSIDWMSNGKLDFDVEAAINSLTSLSSSQKASAIKYLMDGPGGSRP